jgi:hypothetical protein
MKNYQILAFQPALWKTQHELDYPHGSHGRYRGATKPRVVKIWVFGGEN